MNAQELEARQARMEEDHAREMQKVKDNEKEAIETAQKV